MYPHLPVHHTDPSDRFRAGNIVDEFWLRGDLRRVVHTARYAPIHLRRDLVRAVRKSHTLSIRRISLAP